MILKVLFLRSVKAMHNALAVYRGVSGHSRPFEFKLDINHILHRIYISAISHHEVSASKGPGHLSYYSSTSSSNFVAHVLTLL